MTLLHAEAAKNPYGGSGFELREVCASLDGSTAIAWGHAYLQDPTIYRLDIGSGRVMSIATTRRDLDGIEPVAKPGTIDVLSSTPVGFGKRDGSIIPLNVRDGDAGCGWIVEYRYDLATNTLRSVRGTSVCEGDRSIMVKEVPER